MLRIYHCLCLSICLSVWLCFARAFLHVCVCVVFVHLIPYFCASLIRSLGHSVFLYIIDITSSPPPTLSGCIKKTTFSLKPLKIVACFNVCPWELLIQVSFFSSFMNTLKCISMHKTFNCFCYHDNTQLS